MLNRVIKIVLLLILFGCESQINENNHVEEYFTEIVNDKEYKITRSKIKDSLDFWIRNKLSSVQEESAYGYFLDSIICFNKKKDRLVSALLIQCKDKNCVQDDIFYFYGEKINNQWYYFKGPSITVPREMVKDQPINKPLSYQQLHQIALKEVYGSYLNKDGEINEAWFISQFEGGGYGDFNDQASALKFLGRKENFTNKREFFETIHLQSIKNNWYGVKKDSIKQLQNKNEILP